MKIDKRDYENLYDVIVTDQVSPDRIDAYFKDKGFYNYWKKRNEYKRDE